jgi:hypothetical protein
MKLGPQQNVLHRHHDAEPALANIGAMKVNDGHGNLQEMRQDRN